MNESSFISENSSFDEQYEALTYYNEIMKQGLNFVPACQPSNNPSKYELGLHLLQ
jgi:hypothetical protein